MSYVKEFKCTLCEEVYPPSIHLLTCPRCGDKGILDIVYDYEEMSKEVTRNYFKNNTDYSMLRYTPLMSIEKQNYNTLKVGWTPLHKADNLSELLGTKNLYIKDEGVNPTASLKDRASLVACLKALENNQGIIACSSTGNAASSLAGNAAKLGLKSIIFVPERVPYGKLAQLVAYGAEVIQIEGDYKDTFNASREVIRKFNLYNRNAAINPHLIEGKKTVALEIAEQLDFNQIDYVFVSVGDGCTIGGVYKGFYDLQRLGIIDYLPKIIGVQSEGCCPFTTAWETNRVLKETDENTIADSIAVGIPRNPVKGLNAVIKSNGFYMRVSDKEIIDAIAIVGKTEGIFSEPAAAASAAGYIKAIREKRIDSTKVAVVISTGNGLKDMKSVKGRVNEIPLIATKKLIPSILSKFNNNELNEMINYIKSIEVNENE